MPYNRNKAKDDTWSLRGCKYRLKGSMDLQAWQIFPFLN